ncbi:MAG TPA: hypothetical protein VKZ56_07685, partial [Membranihabitans sp.]|nr:hypothetical protein [Membranihabitans sp.]
SYLDQQGILINTDFKRITSRLNTDLKVTDRLSIGQSIAYSNGARTKVNSGGVGNKSLIRQLLIRPPTYAMYLPDGSYNGYQNGQRNPVGLANLATDTDQSHRMIGSQYIEMELLEGLKIRSNMNLDFISMKEDYFLPSSLDYREGWNEGKVRSSQNLTWEMKPIYPITRYSITVTISQQWVVLAFKDGSERLPGWTEATLPVTGLSL